MCMCAANVFSKTALKYDDTVIYERPESKSLLLLPILYWRGYKRAIGTVEAHYCSSLHSSVKTNH